MLGTSFYLQASAFFYNLNQLEWLCKKKSRPGLFILALTMYSNYKNIVQRSGVMRKISRMTATVSTPGGTGHSIF